MKELNELVEISIFYGANKDYVIAGGGNTSFKNDDNIWIKASGKELGTININDFAKLDRIRVRNILTTKYSSNSTEREEQVKIDLIKSLSNPLQNLKPSVETTLHEIINYKFVIHTHPSLVNGVLCSKNAKQIISKLFENKSIFISYCDPGYVLSKELEIELAKYKSQNNTTPHYIFLENHGVFVGANSISEIKSLYESLIQKIKEQLTTQLSISSIEIKKEIQNILPAIRMIFTENTTKIVKIKNNSLISNFLKDEKHILPILHSFTPDQIVYCKSTPLYINTIGKTDDILIEIKKKVESYKIKHSFLPKVLLIKDLGLVTIDDTTRGATIVSDVFEDAMKIGFYAEQFGGYKSMSEKEIEFIDNWDAEKFRIQESKKTTNQNPFTNKIAIVTGGAQGFGGGIVEDFFKKGLNVVIADLNEEKGKELATTLNTNLSSNKALFVKTDVSTPESIQNLIFETVKEFGGLDVFVSNAGILRAGSLEEMEPDSFELMTKVNYTAYFLCTKYASKVLKIQSKYKPGYHTDIIQINSKSGLKGSNKNFAYAGGKFGGIGLTQSFAMELMPDGIKVNSICPGNFFEGPLWADPEKGLFVQYLKAGKVPGAKSIEDVKHFYEAQVPAKRGCRVEDVMKAIYYIIEQEYETGQAVPVTGGQNMLN